MGIEKQGSTGGNYVGGFLQLLDWNAKSRKKLFSSKSDLPEKSKQKKRFDGTLPMTRLQMLDEDESAAGSSMKGSSDYSRASSVTDEDFRGSKGPGVVARLMGLDSLPKSNTLDPYSTPVFDCQSLPGSYYKTENLDYRQDSQTMQEVTFSVEPKCQKVIQRPIEKFQTEILPPKSAKTIPITHHKLLSPIKSTNFIPHKDAAQIMEAAARIIEPAPQANKTRLPLPGSSSVPLKVRDIKEKVQATHKAAKLSEGSQKPGDSSGVKNLRGQSMNKSWNSSSVDARQSMNKSWNSSSVDATSERIFQDSEESSSGVKSKGKSISLALQAKANVQKREALNFNSSRTFVSQAETSEPISPSMLFTSQSGAQNSTLKKASSRNSSNVLRQNNQKQNCTVDKGKSTLKSNLQGGKAMSGDSSSAKRQSSSKLVGTSKISSGKLGSEVKDDKRHVPSSSSERSTRKKRSIDGNYQSEKKQTAQNMRKDKNGKVIQSSAITDKQSIFDQDNGKTGTDVISFTFTAPMRSIEVPENFKCFPADSPSKRIMLNSNGMAASKFSFLGHNVKGGDTLSTFLEQQLKELAHKVEFSQRKAGAFSLDEHKMKDGNYSDDPEIPLGSSLYRLRDLKGFNTSKRFEGLSEEKGMRGQDIAEDKMFLNCRHPSPVSVLEHSSFAESCISSDSADSNHSTGGGNKYSSSLQSQDSLSRYSMKSLLPLEGDAELSDSASSSSAGTVAKRRETTLTLSRSRKPRSWELEYIREMLCNIELMFKDYAMGRACDIINPHLFDQLESCKWYLNNCGSVPRIDRRLVFDCVSECLDRGCRKYALGGCKLWAKGVCVVQRKERLAEDVFKEISGWSAMGDSMVDDLVDSDMSSSPYGRWLDYDIEGFELGIKIESRILNSLIDEVVDDILVL